MNATDYINNELERLRKPLGLPIPTEAQLEDEIVRLVLSPKFRRHSASDDLKAHIRQSVRLSIANKTPINFLFSFGAYKLWRFDEAPEVDFAEFFSCLYYSEYVKPICEIYKPGVWFDFMACDLINQKLNNLEQSETDAYQRSFQSILDFLKQYQPQNLKMTLTPVSSLFESKDAFWQSLAKNLEKVEQSEMPVLTDPQKTMIEMNVRPRPGQLDDPQWREKVWQISTAYAGTKAEPGYHKNRPDKIGVATSSIPGYLAIGTTRVSIIKFWIGTGALVPNGDDFRMTIISKNQLDQTKFEWAPVALNGLSGKNFSKIRIITPETANI